MTRQLCKTARAALGWGVRELAERAKAEISAGKGSHYEAFA